MFKCPNCHEETETVDTFSLCQQTATIDENGTLTDYGEIEHIFDTQSVECPNCGHSIEWNE